MCPLKERCNKVIKIRWPYSNIKSIARFGQSCPYAHHPMELNFPQSLNSRISNTETAKKAQVRAAARPMVDSRPMYPGGIATDHLTKYDAEAEYKKTKARKVSKEKMKKEREDRNEES